MVVEYATDKIRFNAVCPVVGRTAMFTSQPPNLGCFFPLLTKSSAYRTHLFLGKPDTPENHSPFISTSPLSRGSTPKSVANACCYLASDEAKFVTGINLEVDGGRTV
jgi:NAD(P)-dependent dehydrogenase (short-subunit alcohol dehydrogenase family)